MIDRRNISYTQGNPNTPVEKGIQFKTPDIIKGKKGELISHVYDLPGEKYTPTHKVNVAETIGDIALLPFGLIGLGSVAYRGLANKGSMTPTQFGATQTLSLMGIPGWTTSIAGILKAQDVGVQGVAPPGVDIFPPIVTDVLEGNKIEISNLFPNFPDLSGLKNIALVGGAVLIGGYLLSKVLGKR